MLMLIATSTRRSSLKKDLSDLSVLSGTQAYSSITTSSLYAQRFRLIADIKTGLRLDKLTA